MKQVLTIILNWIWGNLDTDLKEMDAADRQFLPAIQKSLKKVPLAIFPKRRGIMGKSLDWR